MTHLPPQVIQDGLVFAVVAEVGPTLLHGLADLDLQRAIGLLQVPHRLQVAGQSVVEVLHGKLLVAHDVAGLPAGAYLHAAGHATPHPGGQSHPGSHTTAADTRLVGGRDAGPLATGASIDAGRPDRDCGGASDGHLARGHSVAAGGADRVRGLLETHCVAGLDYSSAQRESEGVCE